MIHKVSLLSDNSKIIKRFDDKINELYKILPAKYYSREMIEKNCAVWTMLSLMEILQIEDQYFQNMVAPLACIAGPCGAVAAGLMCVGLIEGGGKKQKPIDQFKAASIGMKFIQQFKKKFGSIYCKELINLDLKTMEGIKKYHNQKLWENKCYKHVIGAIEIIRDTFKSKLLKLEKLGKL